MTPGHRNPRYWIERKAKRKTGYPLASLAFYGPDETRASKAVIGIFPTEKEHRQNVDGPMRKWFSDTTDVRTDPVIVEEMFAYLNEQHVERVATINRIIGCPHEEGADYPEGQPCPQCPYWANRDRWTGKLL